MSTSNFGPKSPAPKGAEDKDAGKRTPAPADADAKADDSGGGGPGAPASTGRRKPAHQNAYFTKDVDAARAQNLGSKPMQALRGSEGATDLKRVVLPASAVAPSPTPEHLRDAAELMGVAGGVRIEALLQRQGSWARGGQSPVEKVLERMRLLEGMIEARRAALGRMSRQLMERSASLSQAMGAGASPDASRARDLVARIRGVAGGMHARLAKVLGLKPGAGDTP